LQAIVEYSRLVRLPLNKVSSHSKVNEAYYSFVQEFHREPSIDELSEALNMKNKDILLVLKNNGKYISVDAKMGGKDGDSAMTLLDTLACHKNDIPESNLLKESMFQEIGLGMKLLNQRECNVVNSYYGLEGRRPMTLEEIGDECSLTRERVRQIKERALRRIRNSVHGDNLRTFLD
jgi:RNA polymerase primary sigma factor